MTATAQATLELPEPTRTTGTGHRIWNDYAIEYETGELLHALVRAAKPDLIVECGTGEGFATAFLAAALMANGSGRLVTFETNQPYYSRSAAIFGEVPNVEVIQGSAIDSGLEPDMVFIDCTSDLREREIRHWLTHPGRPLAVVHDAKRPYPFHLAEGVLIPGYDGVWVGRAKPPGGS